MRVYVARHGETTWNLAGRYQGRRESALTSLGFRQARALAGALEGAHIGRVVSSPLLRCTATAHPAAERFGLPIATDDRLIEIGHGAWEGRLRDELAANDPQRYRRWREAPASVAFEGGESVGAVLERWRDFARDLQPKTATLVLTHDAVARVALCAAQGLGLDAFWHVRAANGAYAEYDVDGERWRVVHEIVDAHLDGLRADPAKQAL